MQAIPYNAQDPYFNGAGPVEAVLRDLRVTVYQTAPVGSTFDISWDQKTWAYPPGTGRVSALQLVITNDSPSLETYTITAGISDKLNFQSNPTRDGFIAPSLPIPLIALSGKQAIVKVQVQAGVILVDEWWVVQDSSLIPQKVQSSPEGGSFSDADRKLLHDSYVLLTRVARANGVSV